MTVTFQKIPIDSELIFLEVFSDMKSVGNIKTIKKLTGDTYQFFPTDEVSLHFSPVWAHIEDCKNWVSAFIAYRSSPRYQMYNEFFIDGFKRI